MGRLYTGRLEWALILAATWALGVLPTPQEADHCGVASLETLLELAEPGQETSQRDLALQHNARIPDYQRRYPQAYLPLQYYPEYRFTFQPIMAEMLIDRGFAVVSANAVADTKTGAIPQARIDLIVRLMEAGRKGIVNFDNHYVAVTGYDRETRRIYVADPLRPRQIFSVGLETFTDGKTRWHATPEGIPVAPWRGRMVFFWRGAADFNARDRCPVCGKTETSEETPYCPVCGVHVDRRGNRGVGLATDAMCGAVRRHRQTELDLERLRAAATGFDDRVWRAALLQYPLARVKGEAAVTLGQAVAARGVDVERLSTAEMEAVVCGGAGWVEVLMGLE